ncbi:hypothetical protein ACFYO5_22885 [Streptomyces sp. NPDC006259]|uniref:hypothetical protein n=1 Tax=Streptomyces sp. NPDC006259 TaxID=3364740 RepID=UPI0036BF2CCD
MTNETEANRLHSTHQTWWKAPLIASLLGLPLLWLEYGAVRSHGAMGQYGGWIHTPLALLALAWALPHRRSLRTLRVVAACAALVVTVLPVAFLMVVIVLVSA